MSDPLRRLEILISAQREILNRSLDSTILISPDMRLILVRSSLWQALGPNRQAQAVVREAIKGRALRPGDVNFARPDRLAVEMEAAIHLLPPSQAAQRGVGPEHRSRLDPNGAILILQRALRLYGAREDDV